MNATVGDAANGLVVVDAGGANLGSVRSALERLGVSAPPTLDADAIAAAGRVLLPGVGAAAPVMRRLREAGLVELLRGLRVPLLGICVGMQVLYERSEEGHTDCLGLLRGEVRKLRGGAGVRVPHMGWNRLEVRRESPLVQGIDGGHAYFVHGYAVDADDPACVASVEHGGHHAALVVRDNIAGAQFHPERSAEVGARLLRNFLEWRPAPAPEGTPAWT